MYKKKHGTRTTLHMGTGQLAASLLLWCKESAKISNPRQEKHYFTWYFYKIILHCKYIGWYIAHYSLLTIVNSNVWKICDLWTLFPSPSSTWGWPSPPPERWRTVQKWKFLMRHYIFRKNIKTKLPWCISRRCWPTWWRPRCPLSTAAPPPCSRPSGSWRRTAGGPGLRCR